MTEPTVTITEAGDVPQPTASEQLIRQASAEVATTDAKGRRIVLRKPGVLAQFRLVEMLGASASNQTYMGMVLPLTFVGSIDGDAVSISTKRELEALIQRLDEGGIMAVAAAVQANFGEQDTEADKEAVKN
ncbi:MAG: hypothetical protein GAK28_00120 [Luteibacter sp.]|uniref:hypothetical protein n=1 Tax=Luteibacter sp. TaxID=1886636 RepID=UPI0013853A81|nr:hypothetical protein [Luteibacter sp.]KAF1009482.1 MAG: hypothetical protein GAK28_00120 [Luteibacter sp.]